MTDSYRDKYPDGVKTLADLLACIVLEQLSFNSPDYNRDVMVLVGNTLKPIRALGWDYHDEEKKHPILFLDTNIEKVNPVMDIAYHLVNPEDLPEDMDWTKEWEIKVIDTETDEKANLLVVNLEFVGEKNV